MWPYTRVPGSHRSEQGIDVCPITFPMPPFAAVARGHGGRCSAVIVRQEPAKIKPWVPSCAFNAMTRPQ
ncbi:uncharacterized protein B0H18DRAFT_966287 [Fomitopsis serialis]|uniref:uncharacterized protein n=1 Tax=Fomitopsis serialis TaxID=139415 RepID=UPI002007A477|nr:uncharacterized protein B0H18DRAFT_1071488 [Neoantrodia serialis]XP_047901080.1 uncharacterized protein B0H18DRAFT_966287 [Neoantrodia serialis]KAH9910238.1 hypothetical protein B0H18DRAFT_1071488 [Neoantrodia serialis]KAH9938261.1 hypothetical protein B0H18DRAFT_966287 [Neoantrodia serialis]